MKKFVLLLTATVNPGQMILTALTDPLKRREQYLSSLNHWLKNSSIPIIFVENSNTDLSKFINKEFHDRIEFLTFQGNDYSKDLGKGYGELNCLKYAYENSSIIKQMDFIFKVTGRMKIMNFSRIYNFILAHSDTYIFLDFKRSLSYADSRFFGFQADFIKEYLEKYQDQINDSKNVIFENILSKAALEAIIDNKTFKQLPYFPEFIGVSGTDNKSYKSNVLYFAVKQIQFFLKSRFMNN